SVLQGLNRILGKTPVCYEVDCNNLEQMEHILQKEAIDGVIHFAAYKAVGESVAEPIKYYENNIGSLITVLKAMEKTGVEKLVFSSSCTVYGQPDVVPVTEDTPRKPAESPYGNTKAICEDVLRDLVQSGASLQAVSLRYFNPIGAHSSAEIGELPIGVPANLIPFVTQSAAGLRPPVTIFGSDYNTPDGTCIRDYIHVMDLAEAHVKALAFLQNHSKTIYETVNVGTGKGSSVLEVLETFRATVTPMLQFVWGNRRAGDVEATFASVEKVETCLGWRAKRPLEEALQDAWRWQLRLS
ncbi:MAG TPA: UDP-glucose 4-epimerase GalE, partial [Rhodothermales bacterium]|nr:UDP-glucose 4-epimerase GalE [Rhodothermales bacterium]